MAAAVAAIVLVMVAVVGLSNNTAAPTRAVPSNPSPSVATAAAPFSTTSSVPGDATTTPVDATSSPAVATTPAPPTTGVATPGVPSPAGSSPVVDVAIVGDSISQMATPNLTHSLRQFNLSIDAVGGSNTAEHLSKIEQLASDGKPRDWVIELGTNDVLGGNPNWTSDFANEVAALQAQPCVVFLTVNPRLGVMSTDVNQAIGNAVASHGNFHLLDWGNIEWRNKQWLQPDGIHPSKSGDAELARLERRAVLGCQTR